MPRLLPCPIVQAVRNADTATLRQLHQGARQRQRAEVDGTTALHWAVRLNDVPTAELLIRAGANVKAANRYGVSPLSVACTNGNAAMVKLLLEAGADAEYPLPGGETALMSAARTGQHRCGQARCSREAPTSTRRKAAAGRPR